MSTSLRFASSRSGSRSVRRERGLVLVVGLVILLILTIISVTAMRGTSLEEHMAGNMQFRTQAFQLAEEALREGEAKVRNGPPHDGDVGYYDAPTTVTSSQRWRDLYGAGTTPPTSGVVCASSGCPAVANGVVTSGGASYFIEKLTALPMASDQAINQTNDYYQITAEGVGPNGKITVVLQSTYKL